MRLWLWLWNVSAHERERERERRVCERESVREWKERERVISSLPSHCTTCVSTAQLFVGMLLTHQPFYVGGVDDVKVSKGSAFGAMYAFIATFVISLVMALRDARRKRRQSILARHAYVQVPPLNQIEHYEINLDLPLSAVSKSRVQQQQPTLSTPQPQDDSLVGDLLDSEHHTVPTAERTSSSNHLDDGVIT